MINQTSEPTQNTLATKEVDATFEIVTEDYQTVSLSLPTEVELDSIRRLAMNKASFHQVQWSRSPEQLAHLWQEIHRLESLTPEFGESARFLNHLASLYEMVDQLDRSLELLRKISLLAPSLRIEARQKAIEARQGPADLTEAQVPPSGNDLLSSLKQVSSHDDDVVALESMYVAAENDPEDGRAIFILALARFLRGETSLAIQMLRIALEVSPRDVNPWMLLGLAYQQTGQELKAQRALLTAHYLSPLNHAPLVALADVCDRSTTGKIEIEPLLNQFRKYDEKNFWILDRLARYYFKNRRFVQALEILRHQASLEETVPGWNNIAVCHWAMNEYDNALKFFNYALLQSTERDLRLLCNFSRFLTQIEAFQQHLNVINFELVDISEYKSDSSKLGLVLEIMLNRARCLYGVGSFDLGVELCGELLRLAPDHLFTNEIRSYLLYLLSARHVGEKVAMSIIEEISEKHLDPHNVTRQMRARLLNNMLYTLVEFGKMDEAKSLLPRLLPIVDRDVFLNATVGLYYLRAGDLVTGTNYYKRAIATCPTAFLRETAEAKFLLETARFQVKKGDRTRAIDTIGKAHKFKGAFVEYRKEIDAFTKWLLTRNN